MEYNFTLEQMDSAKKFIEALHASVSQVGSNFTATNIKLFKDDSDNIYIVYNSASYTADGERWTVFYIKIKQDGTREVMNDSDMSPIQLSRYCETLEQITL